jgi:hypothetical protein
MTCTCSPCLLASCLAAHFRSGYTFEMSELANLVSVISSESLKEQVGLTLVLCLYVCGLPCLFSCLPQRVSMPQTHTQTHTRKHIDSLSLSLSLSLCLSLPWLCRSEWQRCNSCDNSLTHLRTTPTSSLLYVLQPPLCSTSSLLYVPVATKCLHAITGLYTLVNPHPKSEKPKP